MNTAHDKDDEALMAMLPWAASGRLSREEMRRVEALLERSSAARAELAWWRSVHRDLRVDAPAVNAAADGDLGLARFRERLQGARQSVSSRPRRSLGEWLRSNWMAPALAACACVMVVQGVMLGQALQDDGMTTLSGPAQYPAAQLLVSFRPEATDAAIRALLTRVQGEIVGGPSALGLYRLHVRIDPEAARIELAQTTDVVADVAAAK